MLGGPARVETELTLEVADRPLTVAQELEDAHPHRMAEDAEELGL